MNKFQQPSNAMQHISNLFAVYQTRLRPPQKTVEKMAAEVITEMTGITIVPTQVVFTPASRTLVIKHSSILKAEILLHQTNIVKKLVAVLGADRAPITIL